MRYHLISVRMALSEKQEITSVGEDMEKVKPLCVVDQNVKWCSYYANSKALSSKNQK